MTQTTVLPVEMLAKFFRTLGDETRLQIVHMLALTDLRVAEIVEHLQAPQNAVSYHLKRLRSLGLLRDRRSSGDARDIYYRTDLERLHTLYVAAGLSLHPALVEPQSLRSPRSEIVSASDLSPVRILFLCTHNSVRSQFAEAIAHHLGGNRVCAQSAGSEPTDIHPVTIALMKEYGINPALYWSKHVDDIIEREFDYVITVCDRVREICPMFPPPVQCLHWSLPDPIDIADEDEQRRVFREVWQELYSRIRYLLATAPVRESTRENGTPQVVS